jgi:hypothetical protein
MKNKPYEVRGFRIDSDFFPVSAAGGGKGDLYCEFDNFTILTEVTMSTSSRQEAMEGEPVRRHVSDAVLKYDKTVYGMFIAVRIDTNTAETFRHGVWYAKGDEYQRLSIVPFTLAQFQKYFELMFTTKQAEPEKLVELIAQCSKKRDMMEAPAWKEYIDSIVNTSSHDFIYSDLNKAQVKFQFPYGISFGTKIKDTIKNRVGCVVGIQKEYILVAFEEKLEPQIMSVSEEFFERGYYMLA